MKRTQYLQIIEGEARTEARQSDAGSSGQYWNPGRLVGDLAI